MQRLVTLLIVGLFFIWILPLGVFIKPSQEKIACDGQRAICLCHMQVAKAHSSGHSDKPMLAHNNGSNKEAASSGGGANQFLACAILNGVNERISRYFGSPQHIPSLLLVRNIDHVPKA